MIWVVVAGAAVAGFVQGLSGFAFSMIATAFWAWVLPPQVVGPLAIAGALAGQAMAALTVPRRFDARALRPFLIGGVAGIPLGVALLTRLDVDLFKALVGALLVIWCPVMLVAQRLPRFAAGGPVADGIVGFAGGIFGGMGGFSGAIPTLWCALRQMDKDTQRHIIQNFNFVMLAIALVMHLAAGTITRDAVPTMAVVLLAMLLPTWLGMRVYVGISERTFRIVVLICLTVSGAALLASSLPRLLALP